MFTEAAVQSISSKKEKSWHNEGKHAAFSHWNKGSISPLSLIAPSHATVPSFLDKLALLFH